MTCSQRLGITGENVEFIWHALPGWTSKQLLEKVQKVVSLTHYAWSNTCTPHNFPNRILFISILNDTSWWEPEMTDIVAESEHPVVQQNVLSLLHGGNLQHEDALQVDHVLQSTQPRRCYRAPTAHPLIFKAEGDLDATRMCTLRRAKEETGPPPIMWAPTLSRTLERRVRQRRDIY